MWEVSNGHFRIAGEFPLTAEEKHEVNVKVINCRTTGTKQVSSPVRDGMSSRNCGIPTESALDQTLPGKNGAIYYGTIVR